MFRCCLPCRGGPQQAPATSPSNSPEPAENFASLYVGCGTSSGIGISGSNNDSSSSDSVQEDRPVSVTSASIRYEQTSPLPHIEEEEELDASHHTSPEDCTSLSEYLISSQNSIRIFEQHTAAAASTSPQITINNNSRSNQTIHRQIIDDIGANTVANAATPLVSSSPRSKQSRKQTKNRKKSSTSVSSDSTTSGGFQISASSVSTTTGSHLPSGLFLTKMQAEQGSIGDLQKYHSRYLKNRRHTLANVR